MKKLKIIKIIILLILIMVTLSGCGVKKLSGTYVNELDNTEYLKFSGESKVSFYSKQGHIDGTYRIEDNALVAYFGSESDSFVFLEIKNKNVLYNFTTAYVKQGFWKKHWKKIVIGLVVFSIISAIYKKITGRDLGDDLDELGDRINKFFE